MHTHMWYIYLQNITIHFATFSHKQDAIQGQFLSKVLKGLCFMAYQSLWVIQCHIHPCRKTVVVQFNPKPRGWGRE